MLMRFEPFPDIDRVARLLNPPDALGRPALMPMDSYRQGDRLLLFFDVPGVHVDAIDLTVERNVLTVRADRRWEPSDDAEVLVNERPQGTFTRAVILGDSLDTEALEASLDHGVLRLTVPVADQAKPRRVEIRGESDGSQAIPATAETGAGVGPG